METTWKLHGNPLRARCSPSTASRATEKRDELQRAAGVDTSTPAGIRREYAEYAPAGTRRAYPNSRRKAPAFAPRRFLTLFSSEGGDRGAAGPRARRALRDPSATRCARAAPRSASASPHRIRAYRPVFRPRHLTRFRALHARSGRITRRWGITGLRATWRRRPYPWRR